MDRLHIMGPHRLQGTIRASGAKNAALPILAATLLTDETVTLEHLPPVRDIHTMVRLLEHLGMSAEVIELPSLSQNASPDGPRLATRLSGQVADEAGEAPYDLVKTMRASVLVLGPLLARRGEARVSLPGGCAIGVRPVDQHLKGLEALGATVELSHGYVQARCRGLRGARFRFEHRTVGGTENVLMAAVLAKGTSVLENCAREPEVVDLAKLLIAMGADIEGAGSDTLVVRGVDQLHGAEHSVIPDRIEAGTYLIGAAMTRGDVTMQGTQPSDLAPLLEHLDAAGADIETGTDFIRVAYRGPLRPRDITTEPHPGFPTDLQAQFLALMTQAEGVSTVTETVFENRFQHVPELARMGASIRIEEAIHARVQGPTALSGARVMATDLRASACLVLAGLAAEGETVVDRIYHLDRGYERMEHKLQKLGADVQRISA